MRDGIVLGNFVRLFLPVGLKGLDVGTGHFLEEDLEGPLVGSDGLDRHVVVVPAEALLSLLEHLVIIDYIYFSYAYIN